MTKAMERAGMGLERVIATSLRRAPAEDIPLLSWPLACGHIVADRTRALGFSEGTLRVEVPDLGWRAELQALAPRYLVAINRYAASRVKRIEFVVKPAR
jgi:hypothetical protein